MFASPDVANPTTPKNTHLLEFVMPDIAMFVNELSGEVPFDAKYPAPLNTLSVRTAELSLLETLVSRRPDHVAFSLESSAAVSSNTSFTSVTSSLVSVTISEVHEYIVATFG